MSVNTIESQGPAIYELTESESALYSREVIEERGHQLGGMAVLALERSNLDTVNVSGVPNIKRVPSALHDGLQIAEHDQDTQSHTQADRLPCLERRNFDPTSAYLRLELYSKHNVFITPLNSFDPNGSPVRHPLPTEFAMFAERRARLNALIGDKQSTAKQDKELKLTGQDVDAAIFTTVDGFLKNNQRGQDILNAMGIEDVTLEDMSAKETIYLIGYLMHELTNYQDDALQYSQGAAPADTKSSLQIIRNGINAPNKSGVKPLGVCRNFADVGEALFNAFKSSNPRLTNVYCNNAGGYGGATTGELHKKNESWSGHAWLDFIAVGENGHMAITTVDPTWTRRSGRSLTSYDMTNSRIGTHTRNILAREKTNYTSHKGRNLDRIKTYYEDQIDKRVGLMKRQHSGGGPLNLNTMPPDDAVLNSAMYYAIDYVISASEFGGSTFGIDKDVLSKQVLTLIKFAAEQPNIVFSPSEYEAVRHGLQRYMAHSDVSDDGRRKLEKVDRDLQVRYSQYSKDWAYKELFLVNEGQ